MKFNQKATVRSFVVTTIMTMDLKKQKKNNNHYGNVVIIVLKKTNATVYLYTHAHTDPWHLIGGLMYHHHVSSIILPCFYFAPMLQYLTLIGPSNMDKYWMLCSIAPKIIIPCLFIPMRQGHCKAQGHVHVV